MKKKTIVWTIIIAIFLIGIFALTTGKANSFPTVSSFEGDIKLYKSGSCGCCGIYYSYFRDRGNSDVEVINLQNLDSIKKQYNIPSALESCHTTVIGDYFVEGHIPLEAIEKLVLEKPDIAGIAMPGMPSGSPGMPGAKSGDFVVYAVNKDGSYEEFMRV